MPKTQAERIMVGGWSKELDQVEIDRFLRLLVDDTLLHVELAKRVDFDANA